MWRINTAIVCGFLFGWTTGNTHPVSVMTGDAVWAENQLILTMRIPLDQLLLHCQVQADKDGFIYQNQIDECTAIFLEIVRNNFLISIPETIFPAVMELPAEGIQEKVILTDLHDFTYEFEIRFRCDKTPSEIALKQTMGNYNRGLQSTALVTFHLDGNSELIPLYNDFPVAIDLISKKIRAARIQPILVVGMQTVDVFLPAHWVAHGLPFALLCDDQPISGNPIDENTEFSDWPGYRFQIPEGTSVLTLRWTNVEWQMRKVEMIVRKNTGEQIIVFSRFKPENQIEL